jgi:hypothetical protein
VHNGDVTPQNQCNLLRLRLRRRYNKNRAIIELRSIADHCARTTAWSQRPLSFDRPVRTGDIIKSQVVLSRPSGQLPAGRKPERVNEASQLLFAIRKRG